MKKLNKDQKRILKLRKDLWEHKRLYYVESRPVISDYEYDMLEKELINLEAKYPEMYDKDSPAGKVGYPIGGRP